MNRCLVERSSGWGSLGPTNEDASCWQARMLLLLSQINHDKWGSPRWNDDDEVHGERLRWAERRTQGGLSLGDVGTQEVGGRRPISL